MNLHWNYYSDLKYSFAVELLNVDVLLLLKLMSENYSNLAVTVVAYPM